MCIFFHNSSAVDDSTSNILPRQLKSLFLNENFTLSISSQFCAYNEKPNVIRWNSYSILYDMDYPDCLLEFSIVLFDILGFARYRNTLFCFVLYLESMSLHYDGIFHYFLRMFTAIVTYVDIHHTN